MIELPSTKEMKLLGLMTMAQEYNQLLEGIRRTVQEIVGEEDEYGHSGEFVYSVGPPSIEEVRKFVGHVERVKMENKT